MRVKDDLLAMSRDLTRRMEKVAETGSNFLSAGKVFKLQTFSMNNTVFLNQEKMLSAT